MESSQAIKSSVDAPIVLMRRAARPTSREWARHAGLFVLTSLTTAIAGVMLLSEKSPDAAMPAAGSWVDYLLYVPLVYLKLTIGYFHLALSESGLMLQGVTFSISLLAILTSHEFGHYIACRLYGVDCTLPFFIPSPPMLGPGTFGAFIKIKSAIPSRRALFDIGVSGPIAGFVVLIPVAILGLITATPAPPMLPGEAIFFNDPLLLRIMAKILGVNRDNIVANPFYLASWIGLLVTSLNLLPVGQLDGGHAVYAVFGIRVHRVLGYSAFIAMTTLAILGWFWHHSPSGFLYVILLAVILRFRHPKTEDTGPLGGARLIVAAITLVVFALSFWPFPITFG